MMISRRRFLTLSVAGMAAHLLSRRQLVAATGKPRARHVVFIYLGGGASHLDTFDPKPGTANGGSFKAIDTRIARSS